ncbi:hypothetical protein ES705_47816 [subsurface metagenome]
MTKIPRGTPVMYSHNSLKTRLSTRGKFSNETISLFNLPLKSFVHDINNKQII